jgi:hypothetical protein
LHPQAFSQDHLFYSWYCSFDYDVLSSVENITANMDKKMSHKKTTALFKVKKEQ